MINEIKSKKDNLFFVYYFIRLTAFLLSIELAIAGGISFWVGTQVSFVFGVRVALIGGLWSAISAYYIINIDEKDSIKNSWNRFVGIFVGVVIAGAIAVWLGYGVESLMLSLFIAVMLIALIGKKLCFCTTSISLTVIYLVGHLQPHINVWWNCLGRLCESVVGCIFRSIPPGDSVFIRPLIPF